MSAASVAAGACGIAPHAHIDPELRVSYSGESDVSESEKPIEASRLPAVPRPSRYLPSVRTRDMRHSLYGSDGEFGDEYDDSSQQLPLAPSNERVDDGASRRFTDKRGTGRGTIRSVMI